MLIQLGGRGAIFLYHGYNNTRFVQICNCKMRTQFAFSIYVMEVARTCTNRWCNSFKLFMSFSYGMQQQQPPPPPIKILKNNYKCSTFSLFFCWHNLSRVYFRHSPPFKNVSKFNIKTFYHPLLKPRTHSFGISNIQRLC